MGNAFYGTGLGREHCIIVRDLNYLRLRLRRIRSEMEEMTNKSAN